MLEVIVAAKFDHSSLLPSRVLLVASLPLVPLQHRLHPSVDALSNLLRIPRHAALVLQKEVLIIGVTKC